MKREKTKLERLAEENLHPSDAFAAQIMLIVQECLVDDRDNERFEDWDYEKIVSKCNKHGEFYSAEEQHKRLRKLEKEREARNEFFDSLQ